MKLVQYNKCLVSTVATDDLVLKHQVISSHSADYAHMFLAVYELTWPRFHPRPAH